MKDREELENDYPSRKEEESITKGEYSFDELAKGVADGSISRHKVLKSLFAGLLGGLLSLFVLPSRDAEAKLLPTLWARVNSYGTLVKEDSKGVVSGSYSAQGIYEVTFNRNVSHCAKVATLRETIGFIYTTESATSSTVVKVGTYTSNGNPANVLFDLIVKC